MVSLAFLLGQTSTWAPFCDTAIGNLFLYRIKAIEEKHMDNLPPSEAAASQPKQEPPVAQQLKSEAESAKKKTADLKRAASEQVAGAFESAKTDLREAAQETAGYSEGVLTEQKSRLADVVQEYCQAAQAASEKLNQGGHGALASRADQLASRLDRASRYMRERKLSEIYDDFEQFARRRPDVVFGLMFAAGLVTARFLKASERGASDVKTERNLSESVARTSSDAVAATVAPGGGRDALGQT